MKRKQLREEALAVTGQFSERVRKLEKQEETLTEQLRMLVGQRASTRIIERLAKTKLVDVDRPGYSIRSGTLRGYGVETLSDAKKKSLERLPNIGSVTAGRIRAIINSASIQTPEDSRFFSDPTTWNGNDLAFVRTLIQLDLVRKAKFATDSFDRASELTRIAAQLRARTGAVGFLSRSNREEAHALYQRIQSVGSNTERNVLERDLDRIASVISAPGEKGTTSDDEVVREWRINSAVLLALAEQILPSAPVDGTGDHAVPIARLPAGAPQLLPTDIQERIRSFELNVDGLKRTLRPYQNFGARFLLAAKGAILGDEMGIGKTFQALAVANHLAQEKGKVRILVVAPVSILENWRREIVETTYLDSHLLHGQGREWRTRNWEREGGIALTSYQTLRSLPISSDLELDMIVVDEAHKIKNFKALQTRVALEYLRRSRYRVLLSGTPLENRASEFIFLSWAANKPLGDDLIKQFGDGSFAHLKAASFRRAVAPGYLRRNQSDVLQELPEILIKNESIQLDHSEVDAYRESLRAGHHAAPRQAVSIGLGKTASKMERLKDLLEEYENEGQKVLIFSTFLKVLDTVVEVAGSGTFRMDGSVPTTMRQGIVDEFSAEPGFGVLAMQIDVGGVGLNIQAASVVIIIEPQWKPSTEWQAVGRAHRMGQTRRVNVHRLLAANTIDERIEERLQSKTRIFNAIVRPSHLAQEMEEATELKENDFNSIVAEEVKRLDAFRPEDLVEGTP